MKKIYLLFAAIITVVAVKAATISFGSADFKADAAFSKGGVILVADKSEGSVTPAINTYDDVNTLRIYAKNTLTISVAEGNVIGVVLTLNSLTNGKRLTTLEASVGEASVDAENWKATWEGSTNSLVLTVGEKATLGSDSNNPGQLHISAIEVVTDHEDSSDLLGFGTCGKDGANLIWGLTTDGVLAISGTGEMADYEWNSSEEKVTSPWYSLRESVLSIVIEDGVTSIGSYAFSHCSSLTSVTIPESATSIGKSAFYCCSGLTSMTIPNSVASVGESAFSGCRSLTSVTINSNAIVSNKYSYSSNIGSIFGSQVTEYIIGNDVTSIGDYAFYYNCSGLTSVTIGNGVTSIGDDSFAGCSGLTSVTLGNSVTNIGDKAFYGCSGLTSLTIPNSVTSIGNSAFYGCSGLASVVIPNSVTSIGGSAFSGCRGLTSVTIPESVTSIGEWAFYNCSGLTSVTIPNSVTSIGYNAFYNCSGLTSVTINSNAIASKDYSSSSTISNIFGSQVTEYIIGDDVTSVGNDAFYNCSGLTSVTLGNSVTSIGDGAFFDCSGLTSLTIPNSVTSIGNSAFYGCSGLASVVIPNSVTSIGNSAFSGCRGLTSVVWNAKKCNGAPFGSASDNITSFVFGDEVEIIPSSICANMSHLTSVTIPNSVTSIGSYAFYCCSGLTSMTIPNSVTSIGSYAFLGCSGLPIFNNIRYADTYLVEAIDKSLLTYSIKEGTKWIGSSAFSNCSGLTTIDIPESVTSIGDKAFYGCSGLTSVTIPNSVTNIGYQAFSNCSSLTSVTINSNAIVSKNYSSSSSIGNIFGSQVTEYIIGDDVTSIGYQAFYGCSGLTSVTIGNSVTNMAEEAFRNCSGLTSVVWNAKSCESLSWSPFYYDVLSQITSFTFGEQVENIPDYICLGMNNLTSVIIPNSVKRIGDYSFYGNAGLRRAIFGNQVERIGAHSFEDCTRLSDINLPESVNYIGVDAFKNTLFLADEGEWDGGIRYIGTAIIEANKDQLSEVPTIRANTTAIYQSAFKNCNNLKSVVLPEGIGAIPDSAFYNCTALTSVTIPESVTSIGSYAFNGCINLTSVTIGNSVTSIDNYAFNGCISMTSVTIGNSVTSFIGSYAFKDCSSLTSVTITDIAAWCKVCFSNASANPLYYAKHLYIDGHEIKDLIIPENVTNIGEKAFYNCSGLTSVDISNSVTSIGQSAFYGCSGLTSVTIPESVTSIGNYTFYNCSGLTSVTIPERVTSIGDLAFYGCSSMITIKWNAQKCTNYKRPFWNIRQQIKSFVLGEEVVTIPDSLCYGMDKLISVKIPNSVETINSNVFSGCSSLTRVFLGNSVVNIGNNVFDQCSNVLTIYSYMSTPPSVNKTVFAGLGTYSGVDLYVPTGCKTNYEAMDYWKDFYIIEGIPEITYTVKFLDKDGNVISKQNVKESESATAPQAPQVDGYRFIGWDLDFSEVYSDMNVSAQYKQLATYTISLSSNNSSAGSVTGGGKYVEGSTVTITATANGGYYFVSWSDNDTNATREIVVNSNMTLQAYFEKYVTLSLNVSPQGAGTITGGGTYKKGTEAIITATTNDGWRFVRWSDGNTDNPRTITVTDNLNITAEFEEHKIPATQIDGLWYEFDTKKMTASVVDFQDGQPYAGDIVIPPSVTCEGIEFCVKYIKTSFYNCSEITSISIPATVIGNGWLGDDGVLDIDACGGEYKESNCDINYESATVLSKLQNILVADDNPYFASVDGVLFDKSKRTLLSFPNGRTGAYTIPEGTTVIGDDAFSPTKLTSVTIPNSVTEIGSLCFSGFSLNEINFGTGLTRIGGSAFSDCHGLKEISIPEGVKTIGNQVFWHCRNLEKIHLPASLREIDILTFESMRIIYDCDSKITGIESKLTSIDVHPDNPYFVSKDGVLFDRKMKELVAFPSGKKGEYAVPDGVERFNSKGNNFICPYITSLTLPKSFTSFYALWEAVELKSLVIYNNKDVVGVKYFIAGISDHQIAPNPTVYVFDNLLYDYKAHEVWGKYNIQPLAAEPMTTETIQVTSGANSVEITWPVSENAETYELVINDKNGNEICTLVFDADGRLKSINFRAPANGKAPEQTQQTGFSFTVTGLNSDTQYGYALTAKSDDGSEIEKYEGTFKTMANVPTDVEESKVDGTPALLQPQKILLDGHVMIIMPNGTTYDAAGRQVK